MKLYTADRMLTQTEAGDITNGAAVLVAEERIAWAGRAADFPESNYPEALPTREFGDATLLPGLIDAHVHLGFDGGANPVQRMMAETDAEQLLLMVRSARELLSVGVTTARDLGARSYLDVTVRDAITAGVLQGPRLLTAGSPITTTGGHCWFMGGEADGAHEVRKLVRTHHRAGVDTLKIMATGGFMTAGSAPWFAQFEHDALAAAVDEAHRLNKQVAAHAHGVAGIERAIAVGVDTIEHCSFVHADGSHALVPELADRLAAAQVAVSPTCNFRTVAMHEASGGQFTPPVAELHDRGVTIIASTDSGIDHTPHHAYVGALEAMHFFGMSRDAVLASATSVAASVLGLSHETGRIEAGLAADLLAVRGNPRNDLADLRQLELVLARGTEFVPDALSPLPEFDLAQSPMAAQFGGVR